MLMDNGDGRNQRQEGTDRVKECREGFINWRFINLKVFKNKHWLVVDWLKQELEGGEPGWYYA